MRVKVLAEIQTVRGVIPVDSIIDITERMAGKLRGQVQAIQCRACGHSNFRQGIGTFRSCTRCQAPEFHHGLVPMKGGRYDRKNP